MLPEYRLQVLGMVLNRLDKLTGERRGAINGQLRRHLQVPGFRNAALAPLPIKVKNSVTPFERNSEMAAQILAGWYELHPILCQQVNDLLVERGWEMLPADTDRTKLPGFLTRWPKKESFEAITAAFHEKYPDEPAEDNDISLMTVWLSGRLPYDLVEDEEDEETQAPDEAAQDET
jgi:hypothetical protein